MSEPRALAKRAAARAAAELVESDMAVGLGTGSTAVHALDRLAERMRDEGLRFVGVPTSEATREHAEQLGLVLTDLDNVPALDLTIDGADEVDGHKQLIKGGGGALLREKIVASASARMIVVVDERKLVRRLGEIFPLPVEVLPFGWRHAARCLQSIDLRPTLRTLRDGMPFLTDNRNYILDCEILGEPDTTALQAEINLIPGVLENGLFIDMADRIFVGMDSGDLRVIE